jgi:hypothetical protein
MREFCSRHAQLNSEMIIKSKLKSGGKTQKLKNGFFNIRIKKWGN